MDILSEKTKYISLIDMTTEPDETFRRRVSLGYSRSHPTTLKLLGGLSHGTEITLDEPNTQKLIGWLANLSATRAENTPESERKNGI